MMLQTIEVEIDAQGIIRALEPVPMQGKRRGLLTILTDAPPGEPAVPAEGGGIESLFGLVKADRSVSLEEMELAIRQGGGAL